MSDGILVLGDTHIGNLKAFGGPIREGLNERCRLTLRTLDRALAGAVRRGVKDVVQLGDLFDNARPSPAVVDATIRVLMRHPVRYWILAGNHDRASFDAPSAVSVLAHLDGVRVFEDLEQVNIGHLRCTMVPYTARTAAEAMDQASDLGPRDVTFAHYGLAETAIELTLPDFFRMGQAPSGLTVTGHKHLHTMQSWTTIKVINLGAFMPVTFGDRNLVRPQYLQFYGPPFLVEHGEYPGMNYTKGIDGGPRFIELAPGVWQSELLRAYTFWGAEVVYARAHPAMDRDLLNELVEVGLLGGWLYEGDIVAEDIVTDTAPSLAPPPIADSVQDWINSRGRESLKGRPDTDTLLNRARQIASGCLEKL